VTAWHWSARCLVRADVTHHDRRRTLELRQALLQKAEEYLASAQDNFDLERATPAAGDAIHAGISARDADVTLLTGATSKAKDHAKSAGELRAALGTRREAASAEKALRELIAIKGDVEYGTTLITLAKAEPLVRRAQTLVELAKQTVRSGH
jgi:uncharacterized protein (UPF0332 family)